MTRNEYIEYLLINHIFFAVVYCEFDYCGRMECRARSFASYPEADKFANVLDSDEDYAYCKILDTRDMLAQRNCVGYDISTNANDTWDKIPVSLYEALNR